jgi:hypothetical protein
MTAAVLLTITIFLLLFTGYLLVQIAHNKEDIKRRKQFFKRHGIKDY